MRWILAVALLIGGCALDWRKGQLLIACVNISAPGFSWQCPEQLQTPTLPAPPPPPGP